MPSTIMHPAPVRVQSQAHRVQRFEQIGRGRLLIQCGLAGRPLKETAHAEVAFALYFDLLKNRIQQSAESGKEGVNPNGLLDSVFLDVFDHFSFLLCLGQFRYTYSTPLWNVSIGLWREKEYSTFCIFPRQYNGAENYPVFPIAFGEVLQKRRLQGSAAALAEKWKEIHL